MDDAPVIVELLFGTICAEVAYVGFLISMRLSQVYAGDGEAEGIYISTAGACGCWVLMSMCIRFGAGWGWWPPEFAL